MSRFSVILLLGASLLGCRWSMGPSSGVEYAHYKGDILLGSPFARIEVLRQGRRADFSRVPVCVERNALSVITDGELLAEVRLAYATWINASGVYGESDFARFDFAIADACRDEDKSIAAYVRLLDASEIDPNDAHMRKFKQPVATCQATATGMSCSTEALVRGYGGPGWMGYTYSLNDKSVPPKPIEFLGTNPSSTIFDPFTIWTSLAEDIRGNRAIPRNVKDTLSRAYATLLTATYARLVAFTDALDRAAVQEGADRQFEEAAMRASPSEPVSFTSRVSLFHTLLHEVGHQFGLTHADNPGADDVTGSSATAVKGPDGLWRTSQAAMAYGPLFFYLTPDDKAGAAAVAAALRERLR